MQGEGCRIIPNDHTLLKINLSKAIDLLRFIFNTPHLIQALMNPRNPRKKSAEVLN
jgi:hypothetical protein